MILEKQVKLRDNNYYIAFDLHYDENNILRNQNNEVFDSGDFSILREEIEKEYIENDINYNKEISYMNDILFLYNKINDFIYIRDITYNKDNTIREIGKMQKEEIEKFIKK